MYNSTIRPLKGKCIDCSEQGDHSEKYIIGGRCQYHYKKFRSKKQEKRVNKERTARPKSTIIKQLEDSISLVDWFDTRRVEMVGICCNCGNPTDKFNDLYFRFCIAHIFPKNKFISVMTHPLNWLELCQTCHTIFDRNLLTASKMKCFPLAVQRFEIFEPCITETYKYLDTFKKYAYVI